RCARNRPDTGQVRVDDFLGSCAAITPPQGPYRPLAAQRKATARRLRAKQAVIAADRQLQAVIQERLSSRWSPQQISGWLRLHHPEKKRWHVCHETIYQALYLQARGGLKRQVQESLLQGRA